MPCGWMHAWMHACIHLFAQIFSPTFRFLHLPSLADGYLPTLVPDFLLWLACSHSYDTLDGLLVLSRTLFSADDLGIEFLLSEPRKKWDTHHGSLDDVQYGGNGNGYERDGFQ